MCFKKLIHSVYAVRFIQLAVMEFIVPVLTIRADKFPADIRTGRIKLIATHSIICICVIPYSRYNTTAGKMRMPLIEFTIILVFLTFVFFTFAYCLSAPITLCCFLAVTFFVSKCSYI